MNSFAVVVAVIPGPPLHPFGMNLAPALVPAGIGLAVLAALGSILVLVGRDARAETRPFRNRSATVVRPSRATKEERPLSVVA